MLENMDHVIVSIQAYPYVWTCLGIVFLIILGRITSLLEAFFKRNQPRGAAPSEVDSIVRKVIHELKSEFSKSRSY